jgi:ribose transport system ATP-binding protein
MEKISKTFLGTKALNDVSFELKEGEVHVLIGENGAGKSTLMKILNGQYSPDGGKVFINEKELEDFTPFDAKKRGVAMIYQELNLAPHLSVQDNILLGQERSRWGLLNRQAGGAVAQDALARLGHGDLNLQTPVNRLSVGMQQVVEIAEREQFAIAIAVSVEEPECVVFAVTEPIGEPVAERQRESQRVPVGLAESVGQPFGLAERQPVGLAQRVGIGQCVGQRKPVGESVAVRGGECVPESQRPDSRRRARLPTVAGEPDRAVSASQGRVRLSGGSHTSALDCGNGGDRGACVGGDSGGSRPAIAGQRDGGQRGLGAADEHGRV